MQLNKIKSICLLGPAFIAATAYVDPGNVAVNLTAGVKYGYLLVWVIIAANLMAILVQYQSAKLGLVTGKTFPQIIGQNLSTTKRRAFWIQAEIVAAATDIAEIIGGAIALQLLFNIPLLLGAIIVTIISLLILTIQKREKQHHFEITITIILAIICIGFLAGIVANPPNIAETLNGLIPRFDGNETILLAASILGATVMPHAIYLHSTLTRDRYLSPGTSIKQFTNSKKFIKAIQIDVILALIVAGSVNLALLLIAAANLRDIPDTDSIAGAYNAINNNLGNTIGTLFAIGLLFSSLASTAVGSYAGSTIMSGLLKIEIPLSLRRTLTAIPALIIIGIGINPTLALILSQVILSLGIPFALIPLAKYSRDPKIMGKHVDNWWLKTAATISITLIVALNLLLIFLTIKEL